MATHEERSAVVQSLWNAQETHTTIRPPSGHLAGFDLEDAYRVGAELCARRIRAGDRRAGLKVGFTNTAVWETLGLGEPICAAIYESTVRDCGERSGAITVDTASFVAPALEPEIVVGIASQGPAWWALGFEIVHCHYPGWLMTPADALADGGLHGTLVIGARIPLVPGDQTLASPFGVELLRDGVLYERATTAAVLGGPLLALARATAICKRSGILAPPQPGEIVTTGSLTSAPRTAPGEIWTVRAENGSPPLTILIR